MDLCLYEVNHHIPAREVSEATGLTVEQVERIYSQITSKIIEDIEGPGLD